MFWYTREKQEEEAAKARLEMQAIKQREEDLMNEVGEQLPAAKVQSVNESNFHLHCVGAWSQAKDTEARPKAKAKLSRHGQAVRPRRL